MLYRFVSIAVSLFSLSLASAGDKERDWKLGRVLDSTSSKTTFATGVNHNQRNQLIHFDH